MIGKTNASGTKGIMQSGMIDIVNASSTPAGNNIDFDFAPQVILLWKNVSGTSFQTGTNIDGIEGLSTIQMNLSSAVVKLSIPSGFSNKRINLKSNSVMNAVNYLGIRYS